MPQSAPPGIPTVDEVDRFLAYARPDKRHHLVTNQGVAAPSGALDQLLRQQSRPADRVDAIWRRIYGRPPTLAQQREVLAFLDPRDHDEASYEDLVHAMLSTSEFLTNH